MSKIVKVVNAKIQGRETRMRQATSLLTPFRSRERKTLDTHWSKMLRLRDKVEAPIPLYALH